MKKIKVIKKPFSEEVAEYAKALYDQFLQKGFTCEQAFELTKALVVLMTEDALF